MPGRRLDGYGRRFHVIGHADELDVHVAAVRTQHNITRPRVAVLGFAHAPGVDYMPAAGQHSVIGQVRVPTDQNIGPGRVHDSLQAGRRAIFIEIFIHPARAAVHQQNAQVSQLQRYPIDQRA